MKHIGANIKEKENPREKERTQKEKQKEKEKKAILKEKDHTPMQQAMDPTVPRNLKHKDNKQRMKIDRGHKHPKNKDGPRNKAGTSTNQIGMKPTGLGQEQVTHGMKVVSPPMSSNHLPQTAAAYHGAKNLIS